MTRPSSDQLLAALDAHGHRFFGDGKLNPITIRSANRRAGSFDDWICLLWREPKGEWLTRSWVGTTDPGLYYLRDHLINPDGCAILAPGQYRDAYSIDLHQGKYRALCQRRAAVRVYRDRNRDNLLDLDEDTIESGMFGINVHYDAYADLNPDLKLFKASAGCQVFASRADFQEFMRLLEANAKLFGNRFDLTLLDEADILAPAEVAPPPTSSATLPRGPEKAQLLARWDAMEIRPAAREIGARAVSIIFGNQARYEALVPQLGGKLPWYLPAIVHHLESSGRWDCHLHNGDSLETRTYHAPGGRPAKGNPPFTWEESAVDAIEQKGWHQWVDWRLSDILDRLERFNGLGYRTYHPDVPSPYLWAGSNHYTAGKYKSDGEWSATQVSKQIGAAVLLSLILERLGITVAAA